MHAVGSHIAAFFRGGRRPRHVVAGVILGLTAGAVCGWNLSFALLLIVGFWLNTPLGVLGAAAACGYAVATLAGSLPRTIGGILLDKLGLGGALAGGGFDTLAALFGFDDYQVVGGAVTALIVALPVAHAIARYLMSAPSAGGETDAAQTTAIVADPMIRPFGWPTAFVCGAATLGMVPTVVSQQVGETLLLRLSAALQAPVTAERFDCDLGSGRLELSKLRVGDARRAGYEALSIDRITAIVDPGLLLRGRLHASEMTFDDVRVAPAGDDSTKAESSPIAGPTVLKEVGAGATVGATPTQDVEIQGSLRDGSRWDERTEALGRLIAAVEFVADLEATHSEAAKRLLSIERRCAPRDAATGRPTPLVSVHRLAVNGLGGAECLFTNLTSRPATAAHHAKLELRHAAASWQCTTTFHLADPQREHGFKFSTGRIAATELFDAATVAGVDLSCAQFESIVGEGTATCERFDVRMTFDASGLQIGPDVRSVAGVDADVLRRGLGRLSRVQFGLRADGRWARPRIVFSPRTLVAELKHQLRAVAAHDLVQAIESAAISNSKNVAAPGALPAGAVLGTPVVGKALSEENVSKSMIRQTSAVDEPRLVPATGEPAAVPSYPQTPTPQESGLPKPAASPTKRETGSAVPRRSLVSAAARARSAQAAQAHVDDGRAKTVTTDESKRPATASDLSRAPIGPRVSPPAESQGTVFASDEFTKSPAATPGIASGADASHKAPPIAPYGAAGSRSSGTPSTFGLRQPASVLRPGAAPAITSSPSGMSPRSDESRPMPPPSSARRSPPSSTRELILPPDIVQRPVEEPPPAPKKTLFGTMPNWFGLRKPTPPPVDAEPSPYEAPAEEAPKPSFPILRSLFGNNPRPAVDVPPPAYDRRVRGGRSVGAPGYATRSHYEEPIDEESRSDAKDRAATVPNAEYAAPLNAKSHAVPAVGHAAPMPQGIMPYDITDESSPPAERTSANSSWFDRILR